MVFSSSMETKWEEITNDGENRLINRDLDKWLQQQLMHLPTRCQEIFILSRKDGLRNEEIADRLNISKRTVENQITIALQHIRKNLTNISFTLVLLSILAK